MICQPMRTMAGTLKRVDRMRDLIPRALQMATIVLTDSEAIRTELLSKFDVKCRPRLSLFL